MKTAYWDTSLLLKLYLIEEGSHAVQSKVRDWEIIYSSEIAFSEIYSSFHRKYRERAYTKIEMEHCMNQFELDMHHGLISLIPSEELIHQRVAAVYRKLSDKIFLRAPDAIHLATCEITGFKSIYTHDQRMKQAAPFFNLKAVDILV